MKDFCQPAVHLDPTMSKVAQLFGFALFLAWTCSYPTAAVAIQPGGARDSTTVLLLDGSELAVENLTLTNGKLMGDGIDGSLSLDDVRQIHSPQNSRPSDTSSGINVALAGDGRLSASAVAIVDDYCTVTTSAAGTLKLPIDAVRSIVFDGASLPADFRKAVETPSADFDRLFLRKEKIVESVTGLVESLNAKEIKFEYESAISTQPRERLVAIVLAQATATANLPLATVSFRDGGQLGAELLAINDGQAVLKLGSEEIEIPWGAIQAISVRSPRMSFLSELKPSSVQQQNIVTLLRPWQRDRSYTGKPLQIGDRTFEKGIGTHAKCVLAFELNRGFDQFAAVAGIDSATEGKGDCVMSVIADGTTLWTQRVKGNGPAHDVKLNVKGVRELVLAVEPGEDLDLADHANWADARLIRAAK
jgi:hypothetical protein